MTVLIIALLLAAVIFAASIVPKHAARLGYLPVIAGWIGLGAGFAWIYFQDVRDVSAWIGIALFGTYAGLSPTIKNASVRGTVYAYASVWVATVAIVSLLVMQPAVDSEFGFAQVIICAQWTALFAMAGNWIAASGLVYKIRTPVVLLVVAFGVASAIVAGIGRSSLRSVGYALRIRTDGEPLQFVMPPMRGFDSGMVLDVGAALPTVFNAWIAFAIAICLVVAFALFRPAQASMLNKVNVGIGAFAGLIGVLLYNAANALTIPSTEPYADAVKQVLLTRKLPGEAVETASLNGEKDLSVMFADLVPELFVVVFTLLAVCALLFVPKNPTENTELGYRRDFMVRGVVWLWLAWLISTTFHGIMFGTTGILSASEWMFTGGAIFSTGVMILTWNPKHRVNEIFTELSPGIVLGVLLFIAAVAYRFGAPIGLSMTVIR